MPAAIPVAGIFLLRMMQAAPRPAGRISAPPEKTAAATSRRIPPALAAALGAILLASAGHAERIRLGAHSGALSSQRVLAATAAIAKAARSESGTSGEAAD